MAFQIIEHDLEDSSWERTQYSNVSGKIYLPVMNCDQRLGKEIRN